MEGHKRIATSPVCPSLLHHDASAVKMPLSPSDCLSPLRSLTTLFVVEGDPFLDGHGHGGDALQCALARSRICQIITFATWIRSTSFGRLILLFSLSFLSSSNRGTLTLSQFFKPLVASALGRQATHMMGPTPWFLNYSISDFVC